MKKKPHTLYLYRYEPGGRVYFYTKPIQVIEAENKVYDFKAGCYKTQHERSLVRDGGSQIGAYCDDMTKLLGFNPVPKTAYAVTVTPVTLKAKKVRS